MNTIVYDVETLLSCFTYVGIDTKTEEIYEFVIHESRNDAQALYEHLLACPGGIGFNNIHFDYRVLHYFLKNYPYMQSYSSDKIARLIYKQAQKVITGEAEKIYEYMVPQLDLFKIYHFDNKAKTQSLKGIEIFLDFFSVLDMPIEHGQEVTVEQIPEILEYNKNDVLATYEFFKYKQTRERIDLRVQLTQKYGIDFMNYSDAKIGEELTLKLYCDKTSQSMDRVRRQNTHRKQIELNKILFSYISFREPVFQKLLEQLKEKIVYPNNGGLKGSFEHSIEFANLEFVYGLGGLHASVESKIYESHNGMIIKDLDISSMYPNLALANNFYPLHLGKQFCEVYRDDIVNVRLEAKEKGKDKSLPENERFMWAQIAEALKISANSVYGKSNSEYSFLYDPAYTLRTTVNGQLLLTMLAEALVTIPDLEIIQVNTDGITCYFPEIHRGLYYRICESWMNLTKLTLEYVNYSKMIISNVNNYIAVKEDFDGSYQEDNLHLKNVKYKGSYEIVKEPHKDPSFKIIPYALSEYFVKGTPIEQTIHNCKNIFMFTGRMRCKSDSYLVQRYLKDGVVVEDKQQKTTRYYVSTDGRPLVKKYYPKPDKNTGKMKPAKESQVNKGYSATIFNKYEEKSFKDYNIDYGFYIDECNKIIQSFFPVKKSLELWAA